MITIDARNVNEALLMGISALLEFGAQRESRNGPVFVMPTPSMTVYQNPVDRVIFYPERDANPFFHFMEGLWMIAGRNDVEWISRYSGNIANFSDDGITFHGAYGYRWRKYFSIDQIETAISLLKENPDDRRIAISMWDPDGDLNCEGKDFPCNLMLIPRINPSGSFDLSIINRSNDAIWGAYGANAVHMSMLQEYMASCIGVPVGCMYQFSTNLHVYKSILEKHQSLHEMAIQEVLPIMDPYNNEEVKAFPMIKDPDKWKDELMIFMDAGPAIIGFEEPFFKRVASPMALAWRSWKDKEDPHRVETAIGFAQEIAATDWRKACVEWLERRL